MKIPAACIFLHRAEGPAAHCARVMISPRMQVILPEEGKPHCKRIDVLAGSEYPTVWEMAQGILREWAQTAPEPGGGYDKTDFTVTWADGWEYDGRYDLQRDSSGSLSEQILGHLGIVAGARRPAWMDDRRWELLRCEYDARPDLVTSAQAALGTYDIPE